MMKRLIAAAVAAAAAASFAAAPAKLVGGSGTLYIGGWPNKVFVIDEATEKITGAIDVATGDPTRMLKTAGGDTPAVIHTDIVPGSDVKITFASKGFGAENMSALKMFVPAAGDRWNAHYRRFRDYVELTCV